MSKEKWVPVKARPTDSITLVVTEWPYCGVGGYFCVALDRPRSTTWKDKDGSASRSPFPEMQPLVIAIADVWENRQRFAIGARWTLRPEASE